MQLESVLDSPREGLDPVVWTPDEDGSYVLSPEAERKIKDLVGWMVREFGIQEYGANVTGSITSNQWKEDSDIDVHVNSPGITEETQEGLNRELRERFAELSERDPEAVRVGEHPLEVYFQWNPYQDLMSVGCYDAVGGKWLVGPELKDVGYDPVSDFWDEDMALVEEVVEEVREIILGIRELCISWKMSGNEEFREERFGEIVESLGRSAKVFEDLKAFRTSRSTPRSEADAMRMRTSRKWKVADSAFKMLDKLGYLRVFKAFSKCLDSVEDGASEETVVETVLSVVGEVFGQSAGWFGKEDQKIVGMVDEGIGKYLGMAWITTLLAIQGVVDEQQLRKNLGAVPPQKMNIQTNEVQKAIGKSAEETKPQEEKGGLLEYQAENLLARTLYSEAGGEGDDGIDAVMTVIYNRTGGDPKYLLDVLKESGAFDCWTQMNWNDVDYRPPRSVLGNTRNLKIWNHCLDVAKQYWNGKFDTKGRNWNIYLNKNTSSKKNVDSWGKGMTDQVGRHHFGYLREHDPKYVVPGTMIQRKKAPRRTYTVKRGDYLQKIAKTLGTTVDDLIRKNPNLKDNPNKLKPGQVLSV